MAETPSAPSLRELSEAAPNLSVLRHAAKAGRLRIRCEPRCEGADPDAGMVWPVEIELPCINGLSCWFAIGNLYSPDQAAQGYTDGALNDDLARDFAAHIVRSLIDPTTLTEAVAAARAEGVREGLERAAGLFEVRRTATREGLAAGSRLSRRRQLDLHHEMRAAEQAASDIRALIPAPPTTPGGRTDG